MPFEITTLIGENQLLTFLKGDIDVKEKKFHLELLTTHIEEHILFS